MRIEQPAPPTPAAARILDAASGLFYAHGITAVGVDTIAERAGTTKKTIYDRYGSKERLVVAYLQARHARYADHVHDHLEDLAADVDPVLAVFDALEQWLRDHDRGCGFINAYAELGGSSHSAVAVVRAEKEWMLQLFRTLVDDHHPAITDPGAAAAQMALLYEGALVRASAGADPAAVTQARAAAARLLEV